jgi:ketosteroid isomerase-like protein
MAGLVCCGSARVHSVRPLQFHGPRTTSGKSPPHRLARAQEKAWNAGDLEGYLKGYKDSPDTLFIGRQVSKGYAQILDDYRHNYSTRASMGTLTFSELEVHPLSDTFSVCLGKYHLDRSKKEGGPADGMFSLVLEKTGDGWKIVLDHTT